VHFRNPVSHKTPGVADACNLVTIAGRRVNGCASLCLVVVSGEADAGQDQVTFRRRKNWPGGSCSLDPGNSATTRTGLFAVYLHDEIGQFGRKSGRPEHGNPLRCNGFRAEPPRGLEPRTYALRVRCSTTELRRRASHVVPCGLRRKPANATRSQIPARKRSRPARARFVRSSTALDTALRTEDPPTTASGGSRDPNSRPCWVTIGATFDHRPGRDGLFEHRARRTGCAS
jgi:hypothetical protein